MKRLILLIVCVFIITGCQPSAEDIQQAISLTQTAAPTYTPVPTDTPTPTPTPIPLADLDLSIIIFQDGDLPPGFEPSQIRSNYRDNESVVSNAINSFHQQVAYQGKMGGRVSIYIFDTLEIANEAYESLLKSNENFDFTYLEIPGLGDQAYGLQEYVPLIGLSPLELTNVVFIRCNAIVISELSQSSAYGGLVDYALRLDERLTNLLCP